MTSSATCVMSERCLTRPALKVLNMCMTRCATISKMLIDLALHPASVVSCGQVGAAYLGRDVSITRTTIPAEPFREVRGK